MKKLISLTILLVILALSFFFLGPKEMVVETMLELDNKGCGPFRKGTNKEVCAFTCNVDWGTEIIPGMLDTFDKNDIRITFFVSGRWAADNPDMLKEIYNRGHEIGNHGYWHKMHSRISRERNVSEIKKTHDVVKNTIGIDMELFAPPSGDYNDLTVQIAREMGYRTILWSADTIDWRKDTTKALVLKRVLSKDLKGGIVLMHPKEATAAALQELIDEIKKRNLSIGKVSDVL